jgi:NitT/TauT family transport system substrate-binding protein
MTYLHTPSRRGFLRSAGLFGIGLATAGVAAPALANRAAARIRIVSNPGLENATLSALIDHLGLFRKFGAHADIIEAQGVSGPFDAIACGEADVCMVSGYNMVLPRIERGADVRIIGAGMRKCALAVYARPQGIRTLADLMGRTVAVGPRLGLLHAMMLQLLKEKGLDASQVRFVDKGSNDQCYDAVVQGEADACCSSISHLRDQDGLVVVQGGNLWQELPRCTFQTAYAGSGALKDRHEAVVAVMAAYGALYDFLMSPSSYRAFMQARQRAQRRFDQDSAFAIWDFNQRHKPYASDLTLSDAAIGYLQSMYVGLGSLRQKQAISAVSDMRAAKAAARRVA